MNRLSNAFDRGETQVTIIETTNPSTNKTGFSGYRHATPLFLVDLSGLRHVGRLRRGSDETLRYILGELRYLSSTV